MKVYGYCPYADISAIQPIVEPVAPPRPKLPRCDHFSPAEERRAKRKELRSDLLADPDHPRHGTPSAYQAGCRCKKCLGVYKEKRKEKKRNV